MATLLNFDAFECDYIDVQRGGQVLWHLRDDIDMPLAMRFAAWTARVAAWQENTSTAYEGDDLGAAGSLAEDLDGFATLDAQLTQIVAEMVRHTEQGVTDDEVARLTFTQRRRLGEAFFSQAGKRSNPPPSSTENRAARRATAARRH